MIGAEASTARGRELLAFARAHAWSVAVGALGLLLPILIAGGVSLPIGVSFGFKSFTRNVALGRSSLTVPGNSKSSSFAMRPLECDNAKATRPAD